jgi:hypothetical protein
MTVMRNIFNIAWIWGLCLLYTLLVGCAAPLQFENAGAHNPVEHDHYDCKVQINQSAQAIAYAQDPLGNLHFPLLARQQMRECMARKGWREAAATP